MYAYISRRCKMIKNIYIYIYIYLHIIRVVHGIKRAPYSPEDVFTGAKLPEPNGRT